jgi:branched-chain amino acid transport system substrate-binding protein
MLAESGAAAEIGADSLRGIEIALDDRGYELLGHRIELVGVDASCDEEGGRSAAQSLVIEPDLAAIIGPTCSQSALGAIPAVNQAGLVMISPSSTAPELTNPDASAGGNWEDGFARTAHNNLLQGQIAAQFAFSGLGARSAALIYDEQFVPLGDIPATFAAAFEESGGLIVLRRPVRSGQTNFTDLLADVTRTSPDVLFLAAMEPEAQFIVNALADFPELNQIAVIATDTMLTPGFAGNAMASARGTYLVGPAVQSPAYEQFLAKWRTRYGAIPDLSFHAHAYDATNIVLNAIATVAQMASNNTLVIGRQALREAVFATEDYRGVTGQLSCVDHGDCAGREALGVYQLTVGNGRESWPPPVVWSP